MQDWQRPQDRMEARETGTRLLRRVTTWIAVGSVAAVGLFGAIGWATIPGAAKTAPASTVTTPAASSDSSDASTSSGDETVQPPAQAPAQAPAASQPAHAVSGAS
jgi:cytoskeletal protein RodZ